MHTKEKVLEILKRLKKEYPKPKTVLRYTTPFELLVATILSAQTPDVHVNKVSEALFKIYKTIEDYAVAPLDTFKKDIGSINFYNNKAKNIQFSAKMLIEKFDSKIPETIEELITLPGVARKTANIILSNIYGINEGIAVDTHVKRVASRLGLTKNEEERVGRLLASLDFPRQKDLSGKKATTQRVCAL